MGEVAANPVAPFDHVKGGEVRPPGTEAVFNIVMDPVADGLHPRQAVGDLPEMVPCEIQQFIRIAIAAGQSVAQQIRRKLPHWHHGALHIPVIGQR